MAENQKNLADFLWPVGGTVFGLIVVPVAIAQYPKFFNENEWLLPASVVVVVVCWCLPLLLHSRARAIYSRISAKGTLALLAMVGLALAMAVGLGLGAMQLLRVHRNHLKALNEPKPIETVAAGQKPSIEAPKLENLPATTATPPALRRELPPRAKNVPSARQPDAGAQLSIQLIPDKAGSVVQAVFLLRGKAFSDEHIYIRFFAPTRITKVTVDSPERVHVISGGPTGIGPGHDTALELSAPELAADETRIIKVEMAPTTGGDFSAEMSSSKCGGNCKSVSIIGPYKFEQLVPASPPVTIMADCHWAGIQRTIQPHSYVRLVPVNRKRMEAANTGSIDIRNNGDKPMRWPTEEKINESRKIHNAGETEYECEFSNHSQVNVLDLAVPMQFTFIDEKGTSKAFAYTAMISPLDAGQSVFIHFVSNCPEQILAIMSKEATLSVAGEETRREIPLHVPDRNIADRLTILFGSTVQWIDGDSCQ